jgi:hypothetical protein
MGEKEPSSSERFLIKVVLPVPGRPVMRMFFFINLTNPFVGETIAITIIIELTISYKQPIKNKNSFY